jgi:hypothetical protein
MGRTFTGRVWTHVRDDMLCAGPAPPAAMFRYSRDRTGEHPQRRLAGYQRILQADAYAEFNELYARGRKLCPITEPRAGCMPAALSPERSPILMVQRLIPSNWRTACSIGA